VTESSEPTDDLALDEDEVRSPPRPARTVPAGAFVVAVMVAAALGILAIVSLTVGGGGDEELEDARFAAGRFAERFLTFDYESVDEWKADILSLSTGGFTEEVDEVEDGLRRLVADAELDARAQVTDIFIGDIERGTVGAVLVYDREVADATGTRTETDRYMQLTLVKVDGEWLVDNVIDIATAGGLGPGGQGPPDVPVPDPEPTTSAPG
jgi:hypothetical protein